MIRSREVLTKRIEIDKAGYIFLQKEMWRTRIGREMPEKNLASAERTFDRLYSKGKAPYLDRSLRFTCEEAAELLKANGYYWKELEPETEILLGF